VVPTTSALTFADGMAVRMPDAMALEAIQRGIDHVVEVTDDQIAEAIRIIYKTTHNCAEGAGAAALAGLIKERDQLRGRRAFVIMSAQNIDRKWLKPCWQEVRHESTVRASGRMTHGILRGRLFRCRSRYPSLRKRRSLRLVRSARHVQRSLWPSAAPIWGVTVSKHLLN
jgi:hypothetical protein